MRIVRWLLISLVTLITAEVALALALVVNLPRMSAGDMVEVRGEQLRVIDEGEGPAVMLLHAATAHATDMEVSIAGSLREQGYRVISVDRPGQGWSSLNDPALIHLDAQGDLLAELMTVLGLPSATVIGHSLGGSVALAMGLDHPERLDGLVLMSTPTFSWDEDHWWAYRAAEHPILGRIFCTFAVPVIGSLLMDAGARETFAPDPMPEDYVQEAEIRRLLKPGVFCANAKSRLVLTSDLAELEPRFADLSVPLMILIGTEDPVDSSYAAQPLAALLPESELHEFEGAGHVIHHSRRDDVLALLGDFLARR
ncbi:MAG: hypothetical protein CME00_07440 [Geminicoccus sp.]|mgnify:FL=1|nr:hypothetical protein [Geminicoccus sp.]